MLPLEDPTDDLTRRVTSDELAPEDLENIINPLGDTPLFVGENQSPGIQPNPANRGEQPERPEKSFREEYRERKLAKKNGTSIPETKELPKTKNQHAITPEDQAVISQIENLVKEKKYMQALSMIARNPKVREILRSKVSEIRNQMAIDAATARIKMLAKNAIRSAIMDILIVTSPWWEIILVLILCVLALIIGIAIMTHRPVDNPPNQVPLGITNGNEAGIYLKSTIMTPMMKVSDRTGATNARTREIHLEATSGGWSPEEAVDKRDNNWCIPGKGCLSMGSLINDRATEEDMDYYMTARFPYVYGYDFAYRGSKSGPPRQGWGEMKDYAGKKLIMFNPKTNKAVVALAAEFGPAPWTGVCSGRDSDANNSSNSRIVVSCREQRAAWDARDVVAGPKNRTLPKDMRAYDITPPPGYTGRIAGGEPKLAAKIGISTDEVVIIGFATDQSLKPGTVLTISNSDIVRNDTSPTTTPGVLPVPGVSQGQRSDCGDASGLMVALYYASNRGTRALNFNDIPAALRDELEEVPTDQQVEGGKFKSKSRNGAGVCLSPELMNPISGSGGDWHRIAKVDAAKDFEKAVTSIKNGDPVIMYTKSGGFYSNTKHIFVLVGYNENTKEFIVNNPTCRGTTDTSNICKPPLVHVGIRGGEVSAPRISFEHLFNYQGSDVYNWSLIVRKKWWP